MSTNVKFPQDLEKWRNWCNIFYVNDNVQLSCLDWDDVINACDGLKIYTKDERFRSCITEDIVKQCRNFIEKSHVLAFEKRCFIQADVFRFLRNCCANSKRNQDYVMKCGLLSTVIETLEQVLKHQESISVKQVLTSGIQLLGNLIVDHDENQEIAWKRCYPELLMDIMKCHYDEAKNYICMVTYSCIRKKQRDELCTTCEGLALVNEIVEMSFKNESNVEWGIFIIESLIRNGSFRQIFTGLRSNSLKLFLLELIEYKLKGNQTSAEECVSWISLDNALFISQTFEDNISKVLNSELTFDAESSSSEVVLVNSLLRLLCLFSAYPSDEYLELRNRKCLLETTLVALRETSKEENKKFFSDLSRFSNPGDNVDHSTHPAFGFKRGLIQLIANLSYHNKMNQDCVREMDCIPLLLDHCNIDDYNPYICQWSIFCLRNILENNQENQEVVGSLSKLGLAPNTRLAEAGFLVEETADNRIKVTGRPNKDSNP